MTTDLRDQLQATLGATCVIERELGGGGMSRVFLARDSTLDRRIVIKVLPPELAGEVNAERFRREIQLAAQLQHPHIVSVLNAGAAGDLLYYTMPFVEGASLRERLARERQLPVDTAVRIARETAGALEYAHARGVVHRDIKPENILLSGDHAMVVDFGIARAVSNATGAQALTASGIMIGTPAYMSPEQAGGEREIDGRSDIYSLGCVLYEMLAGEPPFTGPTAQAVISKRFSARAPSVRATRDSAPVWLDGAVAKALAVVPADRFQTAREFAGAMSGGAAPKRDRRPFIYVAAAALVVVAGYAMFSGRGSAPNATRGVATAGSAASTSIAVIPFVNIGGDTAAEYFADGMTEEIIGALAKIGGVRVVARSSVFALKGVQLDARTIGDTLGAGTLLQGSVRRSGTRLRVSAQLVNTADGYTVWSNEYNRELNDVFQVQNEIARAIAGAMRVRLAADTDSARMLIGPTQDLAAHELYLKGTFFMNTRGTMGSLRAAEFFQQAVNRDSTYALAYVGLAEAHVRIGILGLVPPQQVLPKAKAFALKALALDSTLAAAHGALAHILFAHDWDRPGAERAFQRAIALDPHDANTRWVHGISLLDRERFAEAEAEFRLARELDPLLPNTHSLLGRFYVAIRQPDRAIQYLREAIDLGPFLDLAHQQLGHAYLQKGMHAEALASFRRAAELSGPRDSAQLAYAYAVTGRRAEAEKVLRAVVDGSKGRYLSPVDIAVAHAGLGNLDSAFRWLERGYTEHAPFMDGLKVFPGLETLRGDPRFASLLRRIGLEP